MNTLVEAWYTCSREIIFGTSATKPDYLPDLCTNVGDYVNIFKVGAPPDYIIVKKTVKHRSNGTLLVIFDMEVVNVV